MNGGVEEEVHHRHHLPKMADDPEDEDDNDQHYQNQPYPHPHPHPHPYPPFHQPPDHDDHQIIYPPQPHSTINASPRPHLPRNTPPPHRTTPPPPPPHRHHQTPPPHRKPTPPPPDAPSPHKPRTPPSPIPPLPPQKTRVPPAYTEYDVNEGDDYETYSKIRRQICALIFILLLLIGLTALILWLIYRPHEPKFAAVGAAVYSLNATSPPFISALVQLTILTKNPNRRTTLYYDGLSVTVYYRNQAITPAVSLPPLVHRTRSAVQMSPPVGGGEPVMVAADVAAGLAADEAYGVVALSWVMVGRVRYKAGGWLRIGSGRVYVRCDVLVGLKQATPGLLTTGGGGGGGGGAFSNPTGQVPLLGTPPCLLDI